jgi:GNAT superfamily N-acetyltransferase
MLHPIRVGVTAFNVKRLNKGFSYERTIHGFDVPLSQRVTFEPAQKLGETILPGLVKLSITHPQRNLPLSILNCPIDGYRIKGTNKIEKVATLFWAKTLEEYQGKGLATQLITEAVHLLKKMGVKQIHAQVLNGSVKTTLKQLGFKLVSKTPQGENYTKEI